MKLLSVFFIIDNRPGGAAVIGTQAVAQAAPDGYTLSLGNHQTHAANAAMLSSLPYDPIADFAPIARLAVHHAIVFASGARTLAELAAKGKNGGRVTYASSGAGSASHVIAETFVRREGMNATHIPIAARRRRRIRLPAPSISSSRPGQVVAAGTRRGGCARSGLAPARLPETPDVPTSRNSARRIWRSMPGSALAPARTPDGIVSRLVGCADRRPGPARDGRTAVGQGFVVAAPLPAAAFAAFQREEVARWRHLVEVTGIRLEN